MKATLIDTRKAQAPKFEAGELVIADDSVVVLVTGKGNDHYTFAGIVIYKDAKSSVENNRYSTAWSKSSFGVFSGTIQLDQ